MDKKILIDLAVKAGRKRQSSQTGFVHYCKEASNQEHHTIPLFENFCFALALFKTRLSENVLEAKALLEKLLRFQVEANFPVYLHEYPQCTHTYLGSYILPVLETILEKFHPVLGDECKRKIALALLGLRSTKNAFVTKPPKTAYEWGEALLFKTVSEKEALKVWNPGLCAYTGLMQCYEKAEPAVTFLDLYMGQRFERFSKRALEDHPLHLSAALLDPNFDEILESTSLEPCYAGTTFMWGSPEFLHTLFCHPKKSRLALEENRYVFQLAEEIPGEEEHLHEIAFYLPVHQDNHIFVNGKKATTFQMQDQVTIVSGAMTLSLSFKVIEGEGRFFGHISRRNKPHQLALRGEKMYAAYDWQISMRTLERSSACSLEAHLSMSRL